MDTSSAFDSSALHKRTVPTSTNDINPNTTSGMQGNFAEPLQNFRDQANPLVDNPLVNTASRGASAAGTRVRGFDPRSKPHSARAQKWVLAKGVFDVFLSLSLVFFPGLLYDGPLPKVISLLTTLTKQNWETDSSSAYALASLIMGAGIAGIVAGESHSDDAYKVIAALNGVFALMGLIGSFLHPHMYGSSFLLLESLQDVFWFFAITTAGNYPILETLGLSVKRVKEEADQLAGKAAERYAAQGMKGVVEGTVQGVQSEGQRVVGESAKLVGEGVGMVKGGVGKVQEQVGQVPGLNAFVNPPKGQN